MELNVDAEPCTEPYLESIESIMYLMVGALPDLSSGGTNLAMFVEKCAVVHWVAVKLTLR